MIIILLIILLPVIYFLALGVLTLILILFLGTAGAANALVRLKGKR